MKLQDMKEASIDRENLIESHRYDYGKIYEYSHDHAAYIYLKRGTKREFYALNHYVSAMADDL